jgi:hypothetical protein
LDVKGPGGVVERIRVDNLVPAGQQNAYVPVDAKYSATNDLANPNTSLAGTLTDSQQVAYPWIDNGQATSVIPRGQNALKMNLKPGVPIDLQPVDIYVNGPNGIVFRHL